MNAEFCSEIHVTTIISKKNVFFYTDIIIFKTVLVIFLYIRFNITTYLLEYMHFYEIQFTHVTKCMQI